MATALEINQPAPAFSAPNAEGKIVSSADFLGQWLVLYFYPKDNTPGCTTEAVDFSEKLPEFAAMDAVIVGVSPDSSASHCKFIDKHKLTIQLLSDPDHQLALAYGAWGPKKFMGKEYEGIIRSTFLINPEGHIAHIWPNVRVKGHVEKVLGKLQQLKGAD
ncbi:MULTISPECIES: thioredoxin-dependent thiol peroxidase [unclassified Synechocystis]|uniref:thioredoxin-dependent thiol peroxidase n=1 Tax=unclassified Synechocystis TaxID=2640012 RepID=UPI00040E7142|nr:MULTISPECIES: thioredoxin-dependent thiol peroxidase [unclassified Synechocystis]AIE75888.1 Thiol peroxidase, Bcp-type [Synechocystis sp. PCC 6714]MCT0255186.1 thioredoxin-dependent thiol peroxidase [Synechocystis sp. CS-94]